MISRPTTSSRSSERAPTGTPPGARSDDDDLELHELLEEARERGARMWHDAKLFARVRAARAGHATRRKLAGLLAGACALVLALVAASTALVLVLDGVAAWAATLTDAPWVGPLATGAVVLVLLGAVGGALLRRWVDEPAEEALSRIERDVHVTPRPPGEE